MAKTILGIDFGQSTLKIVLMNGSKIKKYGITDMPENLYKDGHIISIEAAADLLKTLMKDNGIHCNQGAVVLKGSQIFVRDLTLPMMTHEQLLYNLPYEFKDYIEEEMSKYIFDYAVLPMESNELIDLEEMDDYSIEDEDIPDKLHIMAVAAPKAMVEEYGAVLRKAGLKMVMAAPEEACYPALLANRSMDQYKDYCIVDLGAEAIRMYMYQGKCITGNRILDSSMNTIEEILADSRLIDRHLAHTYLINNHEDCQTEEELVEAYGNIAIELVRAINFYRFRNADSNLNKLWICGGGASIEKLIDVIKDELKIHVCHLEDAFEELEMIPEKHSLFQAIAITQQ